jgi:hypothetical protein
VRKPPFSLPFYPVADGQIVAALITGLATTVAAAWAALEARAANRNTKVVNERAQKTAEWERIDRYVTMTCSENEIEAYVGLFHLIESKADWNSDPEQRAFIKRTLKALNAPAKLAYLEGKTRVVTNQPPSVPPLPSPPSPPPPPGGP